MRRATRIARATLVALLPCLVLAVPPALGQQTLWKQIPLGDWFIAGNWSAGVPNSGNSAIFGSPNPDGALITTFGAQALNVYIGVIVTNAGGAVTGRKGTLTLAAPGGGGTHGDLSVGDRLVIGQSTPAAVGEGTLNISSAAGLIANQVEVAVTADGPIGTINLADDSSYIITNRFTVGNNSGHATVNIQSGARIATDEAFIAGSPYLTAGSTTTGVVSVDGSPSFLSVSGGLAVGHQGNGSLNLSNLGSLFSGETSIATLPGSTGAVTLTGGYWEAAGNIFVSGWSGSTTSGGTGSLKVLSGGFVRATMLKVFSTGFAQIDNGSTSIPGLYIIGNPPAHTAGGTFGDILVGQSGSGRMEIRNGGAARGNRGYLGFAAGSNGAALVSGKGAAPSIWECAGSVWVGNGGNGTLEVRDGASVNSAGNGYIAFTSGTQGYALVSGINSEWTSSANLYIGGNGGGPGGSGTLQLENGGTVSAAAIALYDTGTLMLGSLPFMSGTLTSQGGSILPVVTTSFLKSFILGAGGVHVYTNFNDLTLSGLLSGAGVLDKTGGFTNGPGTLLLVGNNTYSGGTTVSAGRLLVENTFGSATGTGPVTVTSPTGNSVLGGAGIISGPVTLNTNSILLGGNGVAASGALTIGNNLTLNPGAKMQLVLAAAGAHSSLNRTAGIWSFPNNLAFRFTANGGAQPGLYDNIITGLTSDPGNVGSWTIETPGYTGTFSYDGAGNIDLNLTGAPPATSCDWSTAAPYPIPIMDQGMAVVGSTLYSFSGISNGDLTANSYKFDGPNWSPIAPLPEALERPAVVSDGTSLYIIGGYNSANVFRNTVYRYNPASNTYTTRAPCLVGTFASAAVFLNGKIYRIGGFSSAAGATDTVEVYDIASNSWSFRASYPIAAGFVSTFTRNGFIYGAGGALTGLIGTNKTYRYDPSANTWSDGAIADLPSRRWGAVTVLDSSGPVLAGGYLGDGYADPSASVIRWDSSTNTWSSLADLLLPRARGGGAVLGSRLSVVGGSVPNAFTFTGSDDHQVQECPPSTFTVTTVNDHNDGVCNAADCTLREAIAAANAHVGSDTIAFASGVTGTVQLASALPDLSSDINMEGPGADLLTVRRNSGSFRIFSIGVGASVTLSGLTIANGFASGSFPANCGGGIYADHATLNLVGVAVLGNGATLHGGAIFNAQSAVTISNCTIATNFVSASGGAIFNYGIGGSAILSLTNCTVHQNSASQYGGAIYNDGTGGGNATLTLTNCTFNQNTATLIAGGIYNDALNPGSSGTATFHIGNTILKTGTSGANLVNDGATVISDGHNLSSDNGSGFLTASGDITNTNPQLNPAGLTNNGGPTHTVALSAGSPAINMGDDGLASGQDQRGFSRTGPSDIGAYEFGGVPPPQLLGAVSRKVHGSAGFFDINLPLTGNIGVECRSGGASSIHQVVATFANAVTFTNAAVTSGSGSVSGSNGSGSTMVTIDLTSVSNAQRIEITLFNVSNSGNIVVPMGVLLGDTTGNGSVNASDVGQTKSRSGQVISAANFRSDVTVSNSINASDISLVKSKSGVALP